MTTDAMRTALEAAAVLLYAVSGMMTAARKRMDIVGTYSLAIVTAFGGGTLRDLLVGQRPFFWVARWEYLLVIAVLCVGFCYQPSIHALASRWHESGAVLDALGLALFTLTGVGAALWARLPLFVASLIGVITGTFGGVLRDVCAGRGARALPSGQPQRPLGVCRKLGLSRDRGARMAPPDRALPRLRDDRRPAADLGPMERPGAGPAVAPPRRAEARRLTAVSSCSDADPP